MTMPSVSSSSRPRAGKNAFRPRGGAADEQQLDASCWEHKNASLGSFIFKLELGGISIAVTGVKVDLGGLIIANKGLHLKKADIQAHGGGLKGVLKGLITLA